MCLFISNKRQQKKWGRRKAMVTTNDRVAHLRMIKDKVREEDQIEACRRTGVGIGVDVWFGRGFWQQRAEERIDERSPYVSQDAYGGAQRGLDVLLYVVGQIVEERLVGVIREDHLYSIQYRPSKLRLAGQPEAHFRVRTHEPARTFRAPHFAATIPGKPPPAPNSSTVRPK